MELLDCALIGGMCGNQVEIDTNIFLVEKGVLRGAVLAVILLIAQSYLLMPSMLSKKEKKKKKKWKQMARWNNFSYLFFLENRV